MYNQSNDHTTAQLASEGEDFVSDHEIQYMVQDIGAVKYCEVSALTQEGLNDVFGMYYKSLYENNRSHMTCAVSFCFYVKCSSFIIYNT